jgi:probable O-glycosylation ligase (exosortase A-associated)
LVALLIWVNITSFFALAPDAAAVKWDRTFKILGFAILTAQMLSKRERLEGFVWLSVLCVAYLAIPAAIKTLVSGGSGVSSGEVVTGEIGSVYGDRVTFSVVLAMTFPFGIYCLKHSTLIPPSRWLRLGMLGISAAFLLALMGTYSRTALLAGGAMLLTLVAKSGKKAASLVYVGVALLVLVAIAPESWFTRMDLIANYQQDESAVGRLAVWEWAWQMALSHPIVGGGFRVFTLDEGIWGNGYIEAHNIYFEMMAEHGFVGLALFLSLVVGAYRGCTAVVRRTRGQHEFAWAADLARAIQISIVAYAVGGSFVSIATDPFLYDLVAIVIGLRGMVERELATDVRRALRGSSITFQPAD